MPNTFRRLVAIERRAAALWRRGGAGMPESCSSARLEHHTDNVGVGSSSLPGTTASGEPRGGLAQLVEH